LGSGVGVPMNSQPEPSAPDLPDKVFVFKSPSDTLIFIDLNFEKYYTYYIYVEIVTPHNCSLTVTLWDPENKQYNIFENDIFLEPEEGSYYEIPFGTALAGNYTVQFSSISSDNVNIYIKIERGSRCLLDKIAMEEYDGLVFYEITRFTDGMSINHTIELKSDYMYKFYMERVSAISFFEDNVIRMNYSIHDPDDLEYSIYFNELLVPINEIDIYKFGTAIEGEYTISITIKSGVEYTNIGYSITELYKISHGVDPNQSTTPNNSSGNPTFIISLPKEWTAGIAVFFGVIIIGLVVVIRKKQSSNIGNFKERNYQYKNEKEE
jgi:hypothetical protein